jgi:dienelactone hydrolase
MHVYKCTNVIIFFILKTYNYEKDWKPGMDACMNYVKSIGAIHIGLLGYCFGAMITTLTAMDDNEVRDIKREFIYSFK